jgi:hypothetical protein
MTELKFLSAGMLAAAMLATAVMARKYHLNTRRVTRDANASATPAGC